MNEQELYATKIEVTWVLSDDLVDEITLSEISAFMNAMPIEMMETSPPAEAIINTMIDQELDVNLAAWRQVESRNVAIGIACIDAIKIIELRARHTLATIRFSHCEHESASTLVVSLEAQSDAIRRVIGALIYQCDLVDNSGNVISMYDNEDTSLRDVAVMSGRGRIDLADFVAQVRAESEKREVG